MKMIEVLKKEIQNKNLLVKSRKTKHWKKSRNSLKNSKKAMKTKTYIWRKSGRLESGTRSNKETQTEEILEFENIVKWTRIIHTSIINRIQVIEERLSGVKDKIEETDPFIKEKVKSKKKKINTKHPVNHAHHEKAYSKKNGIRRRRIPAQKFRKHI